MDKTTLLKRRYTCDPWTLAAIRDLANLMPAHVVGPPQPWSASPSRRPIDIHGRYPGGMHHHAMAEFCLAISGRPVLDIEKDRFSMARPALAILPAGIAHCEGWTRQHEAYELAWLSLSRVSVHIMRVAYRPPSGWNIAERHLISTPVAQGLVQLMGGSRAMLAVSELDMLRANLLAVFSQLHQQVMSETSSRSALNADPRNHHSALMQVKHLLDHHYMESWTLEQLANLTRLTPNYLNRIFKQWTGRSVHQYLTHQRMMEAARLLHEKQLLVKEIAHKVGYQPVVKVAYPLESDSSPR